MQGRTEPRDCPDCGVAPGQLHHDHCDVEQCRTCGHQLLSCGCEGPDQATDRRLPWTGFWPGDAECVEFGWYAKLVQGRGWVRCDKDDPDAIPDQNRLHVEGRWDREQGRFVQRPTV